MKYNPSTDLLIINKKNHSFHLVKNILLESHRNDYTDVLNQYDLKLYYSLDVFQNDLIAIKPYHTHNSISDTIFINEFIDGQWTSKILYSSTVFKHKSLLSSLITIE